MLAGGRLSHRILLGLQISLSSHDFSVPLGIDFLYTDGFHSVPRFALRGASKGLGYHLRGELSDQ